MRAGNETGPREQGMKHAEDMPHPRKAGRRAEMKRLDAINETSYLSVPNAGIYRKIMRHFYREYEKMNLRAIR